MVRYSNARSFGMIRIRSYARLVQTLRSSRVVGTWTYHVDMAHMAPGMAPRPGVVAQSFTAPPPRALGPETVGVVRVFRCRLSCLSCALRSHLGRSHPWTTPRGAAHFPSSTCWRSCLKTMTQSTSATRSRILHRRQHRAWLNP